MYMEESLKDDLNEKPGNYSKWVTVYCVLPVRTKWVIIVFPSAKKMKMDPEPVVLTGGKSFYRKPPTKSALMSLVPVMIAPTTEGMYQLPTWLYPLDYTFGKQS